MTLLRRQMPGPRKLQQHGDWHQNQKRDEKVQYHNALAPNIYQPLELVAHLLHEFKPAPAAKPCPAECVWRAVGLKARNVTAWAEGPGTAQTKYLLAL
jgi:hypothetical protein